MAKTITGPYAEELTALNAELEQWNKTLAATDAEIGKALAKRDVDALARLRAKRNVIPELIRAISDEHSRVSSLRGQAIAQQMTEAREAQYRNVPRMQAISDPTDPTRKGVIYRGTIG